jgi:hypothetical protein
MGKKKVEKNNNEDKYKDLEKSLSSIFGANKSDEENTNVHSLDLKMVALLEKEGYQELASNISERLEVDLKNNLEARVKGNKIGSWMTPAFLGFFSVIAVSTIAVTYFLSGENTEPVVTNRDITRTSPTVTLSPQNFTESGHVSKDNSFVIEVAGNVTDNIKDSLSIEPPVDFEVEIEETNGNSIISMSPQGSLESGTSYTVSLANIEFNSGEVLDQAYSWVMDIEPNFETLSFSPKDGSESVAVDTNIEFNFSHKDINIDAFSSAFTISPSVPGNIDKFGTKVVFTPENDLDVNTKYQVSLNSTVSTNNEITLTNPTQFEFTTGNKYSSGETIDSDVISFKEGSPIEITYSDDLNASIQIKLPKEITLDTKLYKVSEDDVVSSILEGNLSEIPQDAKLVDSTRQYAEGEYQYNRNINEKGAYILTIEHAVSGSKITKYFVRTDLILNSEVTDDKSNGVVYSFTDFEPVKDCDITSYTDSQSKNSAKSNDDGFFDIKSGMLLIASDAESFTFIGDGSLISPNSYYSNSSSKVSEMLTSKKIYNPGEQVSFEVFFIEDSAMLLSDIRVVASTQPSLNWFYPNESETLLNEVFFVTTDSTVKGNFKLPENLEGNVHLFVLGNGELLNSSEIEVNEKEQSTELEINLNQEKYIQGESINIDMDVDNSIDEITLNIYRTTLDPVKVQDGYYVRNGKAIYGEIIDTYKYNVEEKGNLKEVFTPLLGIDMASAYTYTFEILAPNGTSDIESAIVFNSRYAVGASIPQKLIEVGNKAHIDIISTNQFNGDPKPNQDFKIEISRHWKDISEVIGNAQSESLLLIGQPVVVKDTSETVFELEDKTDENGRYKLELSDLESGWYEMVIVYGNNIKDVYTGFFNVVNANEQYSLQAIGEDYLIEMVNNQSAEIKGNVNSALIYGLSNNELLSSHDDMEENLILGLGKLTESDSVYCFAIKIDTRLERLCDQN